jgi:hypothetical protein
VARVAIPADDGGIAAVRCDLRCDQNRERERFERHDEILLASRRFD